MKALARGRQIAEGILAVQPVFAVPVYFSVLFDSPPLWLGMAIAIAPLGLRFWLTRRFITRTPFDIPILIFILGMMVGLLVSSHKAVALGALGSTLASILIYYGLVGNGNKGNRYWLLVGGVICLITLVLGIWFFSEGTARYVSFNTWFFKLFERLPKTGGSVLQFNSLGTLLAVIIPALGSMAVFDGRGRLRVAAMGLGAVFFGMLIMSASGGGWIATACGSAFVSVYWRKWTALVVVPVAGIVTGAGVVLYDQVAWVAQTFAAGHLLDRVRIWNNTLQLIHGQLVFGGLGLGDWNELYNRHFGERQIHVHNAYLQLYGDTGLLGMAALIIAAVVFVRLSTRILCSPRQHSWYGIGVGMTAAMIAGATMAMYDVTTTVTVVGPASYIYMSVPLLWVWGALFVASYRRLTAGRS